MNCAHRVRIPAWLDGDVTQNEALELEQHVASCGPCQTQRRRLQNAIGLLRSALPTESLPTSMAAHTARKIRMRAHKKSPAPWVFFVGAIASAAVLSVFVLPTPPQTAVLEPGASEFTPRGAAHPPSEFQRRLGVDIFEHRHLQEGVRLQDGGRLDAGAGLSFVLYNRSGRDWHYMLFGIDAKAQVHWFYPTYTTVGSNPLSPRLASKPEVVALPEGVTAEDPATGSLKLVALFTPSPLHVQDVEDRVASTGVRGLSEFPGTVLQVLNVDVFR
jgi:hypothetical protein